MNVDFPRARMHSFGAGAGPRGPAPAPKKCMRARGKM